MTAFSHIAGMLTLMVATGAAYGQLAVRGETVYTMAGDPLQDAVVVIENGKISRIGTETDVDIPAGFRV